MQRRSSPQDISWFLDLTRNGQIDMDPPYQRRSVWTLKDRRFFLDTVFRGYPSPPIFLHKTLGDGQKTIYAVVDGKQRLQTLFMFAENELALAGDFGDERLNGKTWMGLADSEKQLFWDYVVPVEFLSFDPNDTKEVNQAFDRLNRNMRKLEPQELRHARWDGWFIKFVEGECDDAVWRELGVVTNARSKRMKDAQFISELLLVVIEHKQSGFDQLMLDDAYARYEEVEDADLPIDPDEIRGQVAEAKQYLLEMQKQNNCIKEHAKTLAVFYTLWAAIVLHRDRLPEARAYASLFADFKTLVDSAAVPNTRWSEGDDPDLVGAAIKFQQGTKGASTDFGPRKERLEALLASVERSRAAR